MKFLVFRFFGLTARTMLFTTTGKFFVMSPLLVPLSLNPVAPSIADSYCFSRFSLFFVFEQVVPISVDFCSKRLNLVN